MLLQKVAKLKSESLKNTLKFGFEIINQELALSQSTKYG